MIGSVLYSLPFVVQPLQSAFQRVPPGLLQAAATLGASPLDQFRSVVLPVTRRSFIAAAVLGFTHTVGEFGVVLMIGGNIPGETQVLSIALYDQVETLRFAEAHRLAAGLLAFSLGLDLRLDCRGEDGFRLQLDCRLPDSGVTAVFGPSGSGKSTLLDCIAGLRNPEPGSVIRFREAAWLQCV